MKKTSILFIGNSFTYFNNMPHDIFSKICNYANLKVTVDSIAAGGYKLIQFADRNDEYGKNVYEALENKKYDIVILQEQSKNPICDYEEFLEGAGKLSILAKKNGASVYLYQTWGYKEGYKFLSMCGGTTDEMEKRMKFAYEKAAATLNCSVSPVGTAFLHAKNNFEIELYNEDLFHPSLFGSILAAWVLFSTIFNIKPSHVNYDCGISKKDSETLKIIAEKTVFNKK